MLDTKHSLLNDGEPRLVALYSNVSDANLEVYRMEAAHNALPGNTGVTEFFISMERNISWSSFITGSENDGVYVWIKKLNIKSPSPQKENGNVRIKLSSIEASV